MKHKLFNILIATVAAIGCIFSFSACDSQQSDPEQEEKHTHSYTQRVVPPTCTEQGYTLYTCIDNDSIYEDSYVNALGHKFQLQNRQGATCSEKGWEEYACARCDQTKKVELEIDPNAHLLINHEAQPATCTQKGWQAYDTCALCNYSSKVELDIDPNAHKLIHHNGQSATCTQKGCTAYDTCTLCDYSSKVETDINPNAHNYVNGTCSLCGAIEQPTHINVVDRLVNLPDGLYSFTIEIDGNYLIMLYCGNNTINLNLFNANKKEILSYSGGSCNKQVSLTAGIYTFNLSNNDEFAFATTGFKIKSE